ncbi:MAG: copper chaperone PCu(A)C [Rhodobacteraceae bacterium]|nr:copper chaperone PCu(A)C [Paracoccaceae bacterium]
MTFKSTFLAGLIAAATALPAAAADIMVMDSYARAAMANAKTGAAFLMIHNTGETDDRLVAAASPAAKRVELHTHIESGDGIMKMVHVEEGFELPAGGMIEMKRGGKHVMFMGLTDPFEQGEMIPLTLTFEKAGEMQIEVPVDLERQDGHGMSHDHGTN